MTGDVSREDRAFAARLRQAATAIEAGELKLPELKRGGGPPVDVGEARHVRVPESFRTVDDRGAPGCHGLEVGGRSIGELADDPVGLRWLRWFETRAKSARLKEAISLVLQDPPVMKRVAEMEGWADTL